MAHFVVDYDECLRVSTMVLPRVGGKASVQMLMRADFQDLVLRLAEGFTVKILAIKSTEINLDPTPGAIVKDDVTHWTEGRTSGGMTSGNARVLSHCLQPAKLLTLAELLMIEIKRRPEIRGSVPQDGTPREMELTLVFGQFTSTTGFVPSDSQNFYFFEAGLQKCPVESIVTSIVLQKAKR